MGPAWAAPRICTRESQSNPRLSPPDSSKSFRIVFSCVVAADHLPLFGVSAQGICHAACFARVLCCLARGNGFAGIQGRDGPSRRVGGDRGDEHPFNQSAEDPSLGGVQRAGEERPPAQGEPSPLGHVPAAAPGSRALSLFPSSPHDKVS